MWRAFFVIGRVDGYGWAGRSGCARPTRRDAARRCPSNDDVVCRVEIPFISASAGAGVDIAWRSQPLVVELVVYPCVIRRVSDTTSARTGSSRHAGHPPYRRTRGGNQHQPWTHSHPYELPDHLMGIGMDEGYGPYQAAGRPVPATGDRRAGISRRGSRVPANSVGPPPAGRPKKPSSIEVVVPLAGAASLTVASTTWLVRHWLDKRFHRPRR
jgi:hypothetical protein